MTISKIITGAGTLCFQHEIPNIKPISAKQAHFLSEIIIEFNLETFITLSLKGRGYLAKIQKKGVSADLNIESQSIEKDQLLFFAQLSDLKTIEVFSNRIEVGF